MKKIKTLTATLGLLGIIILSNTSAHAGIVLAGRAANPTNTTPIERVFNSIRNVVIGQLTGVTIQSRTGLLMSDYSSNRTPVYITD